MKRGTQETTAIRNTIEAASWRVVVEGGDLCCMSNVQNGNGNDAANVRQRLRNETHVVSS
jgi:hypothetical protein